jgi:hypothetical protein
MSIFPPFTPTSFKSSCAPYDPSIFAHLSLTAKLEFTNSNCLLFTLSKTSLLEIPVLVKLTNEHCGEHAHNWLAEYNIASTSFASGLEGPSKVNIAGLYKTSPWDTLSASSIIVNISGRAGPFRYEAPDFRLYEYGDLWSPNLMVKITPTGEILVRDDSGNPTADVQAVDFNWTGRASHAASQNPGFPWRHLVGRTWGCHRSP